MSDSLLRALKVFVVVSGVVIVVGTATLIWLVVKRGANVATTAPATAPAGEPGTVDLPPGGEVTQLAVSGSRLVLLGRAPGEGQFVVVVDLASGERRRLFRLAPAAAP
jgi:hypothetical protein